MKLTLKSKKGSYYVDITALITQLRNQNLNDLDLVVSILEEISAQINTLPTETEITDIMKNLFDTNELRERQNKEFAKIWRVIKIIIALLGFSFALTLLTFILW